MWSDSDDDANAGGKRRELLFSFSSLLKPLRAFLSLDLSSLANKRRTDRNETVPRAKKKFPDKMATSPCCSYGVKSDATGRVKLENLDLIFKRLVFFLFDKLY